MILHIGKGVTVRHKDLIGIFDMDTATVSGITRDTLKHFEKQKRVEYADSDIPRSFLLTTAKEGHKIFLSHISSQGLRMRVEKPLSGTEEGM